MAEQAEWQRSEIAIQEHDFSRAVRALQAFVTRHHDSERAVDGLYLLGSIYDREFDDEKSAGAAYRQLVARPDAAPGLRKKAAQRLQDLGSEE